MIESRKISVTQLLALFLLYLIFFSGIWTGISKLGWSYWAILFLFGITLCFLPHRFQDQIELSGLLDRYKIILKSMGLKEVLISLLVILPIGLFLGITWNQEFPFSGDHDFHLWASLKLSKFWATYFWIIFPHLILGFWFLGSRFTSWWIFSGYLIILFAGQVAPAVMPRYPAMGYIFSSPLMLIAKATNWDSPLNALRLSSFLSVCVWIFILRPMFLKRKPDEAIILLAGLFFLQKDIFYYFSTSYLEPWSLIFVIIGLETLLQDDCQKVKWSLLWIGLAAVVKEQAILLLPFVFVGCMISIKHIKSFFSSSIYLVLIAIISGIPFLYYYCYRKHESVWRGFNLLPYEHFASKAHIYEFLRRFHLQWKFSGEIALIIFLILIIYCFIYFKNNRLRFTFITIISGSLFSILFFYVDGVSDFWTGYPRFNLFGYAAIFTLTIPLVIWLVKFNRKLFAICSILILGLNIIPLYKMFKVAIRPSPFLSYIEHYEAPIYLSIRHSINIFQKDSNWNVNNLKIIDRFGSLGALSDAYIDLIKHYKISVTTLKEALKEKENLICVCEKNDEAVLIPSMFFVGLNSDLQKKEIEMKTITSCKQLMEKKCRNVLIDSYEGEILAIVGWGIKKDV